MGTDMETNREKTGRVLINEFSLSSIINMISFPNKQKKPYACLNSETGKPYDFCLFYLSAVIMIAQGSRESQ